MGKQFVAIDGEGITDLDGSHRYILLCASTGKSRFRASGLSTKSCLDFLLRLKRDNPETIFVAFGLGYDVNMILSDLPRSLLEELWQTGRVKIKARKDSYKLEWIPNKSFTVYGRGKRIRIYDTWSFFQSSFVKAINKWRIGTEQERQLVESRKGEREAFELANSKEIRQYCLLECRMLVSLCERLRNSLDSAHIQPHEWHGPGAIAARVLRSQGIKQHHVYDSEFGTEIQDAIMRAYFGGRTEMFQQGEFDSAYFYDLRSAYPAAITRLPSLAKGKWRRVDDFQPEEPWALYLAFWRDWPGAPTPLPYRYRNRRIIYPKSGLGWYHAVELKAVMQYPIQIIDGFVFTPADDERPFEFVREYYDLRREMQSNDDAAEYAYKLALNSLYGKLAQGFGYRDHLPPFQSYYWAGLVTAITRANMFRLMMFNPTELIFCATDGLAFTSPQNITESDTLGGVEKGEVSNLFVASNGIYNALDADGREIRRSRGFFTRDLDFEAMREIWRDDGVQGRFPHTSRRFIGIGGALMRKEFEAYWRRWFDMPRELKFFSDTKFYEIGNKESLVFKTGKSVRLIAPKLEVPCEMSLPYVPKTSGLDSGRDPEFISGIEQPILAD